MLTDYLHYRYQINRESQREGSKLNSALAKELSAMLLKIESKADSLSQLPKRTFTPASLERALELLTYELDYVLGVTVAFCPGYSPRNDGLPYSPVYDRTTRKIIYIEELYDYTSDTVASARWFTETIKAPGPIWIDPYFAEGLQKLVTDYAVPIKIEENGVQKNIGVLTYTVAIDELRRRTNATLSGKTGYAALASRTGRLISHPNTELVLQSSIQSIAKAINRVEEGRQITEIDSGSFEFTSLYTKEPSFLFFNTLPQNGWKVFSVFSKRDFVAKFKNIKRKTINLWLAGTLLGIAILIGFLSMDGYQLYEKWLITGAVSIGLMGNIAIVWILNLEPIETVSEDHLVEIVDRSVLNNFIDSENSILDKISGKTLKTIPTGIFIEEMSFVDSYTINISGRLWQKITPENNGHIKPGVRFPQLSPFAEAAYTNLLNIEEFEDYTLYTWEFRNTLRMDFNYSKYPFDQRRVSIKLQHPDYLDQVLLVPDLDSYIIINPTQKPAINPDLTLSNGRIMSSKFSYSAFNPRNNFGLNNYDGLNEMPELQLNVLVQRNFINSFIADVIPVIVVAVLVFLVVYSSSLKKSSLSGISSLGAIEIAAAFFFVLLLAHIDMRRKIMTTDITYIEQFYFIMYFILGIVASNIVYFTKAAPTSKVRLTENLLFKLSYWPILLGTFLLITLIKFY